jgi:hypothetical protein
VIALVLSMLATVVPAPVVCAEDSWCWNNLTQGNHIGHYVMAPS